MTRRCKPSRGTRILGSPDTAVLDAKTEMPDLNWVPWRGRTKWYAGVDFGSDAGPSVVLVSLEPAPAGSERRLMWSASAKLIERDVSGLSFAYELSDAIDQAVARMVSERNKDTPCPPSSPSAT